MVGASEEIKTRASGLVRNGGHQRDIMGNIQDATEITPLSITKS